MQKSSKSLFCPGFSYEEIIRLFFYAHNPSTLNRQGNDVGTQYRSIILAHYDKQLTIAQNLKNELNNDKKFFTQAHRYRN